MGLFASLRQLLGTALALAQVRLELLGTEVELEKRRILAGLFWAALALMMLGLGLLLLTGFILLLFWEDSRLAAVATLTAISLGLALFFFAKSQNLPALEQAPF